GTILTVSAVFQGIGKTYPTLVCALADNLLFVIAVFTLPAFFNWGVSSVWWIKLVTAVLETVLCSVSLKYYFNKMPPLSSQSHLK
ncbi:MAG: hypothetical protein KAJ25_00735, partial [Desulfobacula sp.]|nr:hypothetical protein [Desulfobacula sp.]